MEILGKKTMENFLNASSDLRPADAVAAIIIDKNEKLLLQLRDDYSEIFFPNHWGCFGGAIEHGESTEQALIREVKEELEIDIAAENCEYFINVDFNMKRGGPVIKRYFYVVRCKEMELQNITVNEGQGSRRFSKEEALSLHHVTPYDRLAIWCYFSQSRIV